MFNAGPISSDQVIGVQLTRVIQARLVASEPLVTPLIAVIVLNAQSKPG
jgi:hypothetical protein